MGGCAVRRCSVAECSERHRAKGFCNAHYIQMRKFGYTSETAPPRTDKGTPLAERLGFHSMPVTETGCIVWLGTTSVGYGKIRIEGETEYTHRVAYEQGVGPIPSGMYIDHRCGVRTCINTDHLRLATPSENVKHKTVLSSNNTSGHRGVFRTRNGGYTAQVTVDGRSVHLGTFSSVERAAEVAMKARRVHYGEFRGLV